MTAEELEKLEKWPKNAGWSKEGGRRGVTGHEWEMNNSGKKS